LINSSLSPHQAISVNFEPLALLFKKLGEESSCSYNQLSECLSESGLLPNNQQQDYFFYSLYQRSGGLWQFSKADIIALFFDQSTRTARQLITISKLRSRTSRT